MLSVKTFGGKHDTLNCELMFVEVEWEDMNYLCIFIISKGVHTHTWEMSFNIDNFGNIVYIRDESWY